MFVVFYSLLSYTGTPVMLVFIVYCGIPVMSVRVLVVHVALGLHDVLHLGQQTQVVSLNLLRTLLLDLIVRKSSSLK